MTLERWLRLIAGTLVLVSISLSFVYSPYWLIMTGLVGFSLFQSGFTNWCPMMALLRFLGVKDEK